MQDIVVSASSCGHENRNKINKKGRSCGRVGPIGVFHNTDNVVDRVGFLSTLQDTLGFVPKVEFNAGVIAAGAARIESTVIGNSSAQSVTSEAEVLKSQSQVYLPINNTLSQHGHVHAFLQQCGQGVQHLASRVQDLIAFVERVNNYRHMTGRGFSFLSIPRSCEYFD